MPWDPQPTTALTHHRPTLSPVNGGNEERGSRLLSTGKFPNLQLLSACSLQRKKIPNTFIGDLQQRSMEEAHKQVEGANSHGGGTQASGGHAGAQARGGQRDWRSPVPSSVAHEWAAGKESSADLATVELF